MVNEHTYFYAGGQPTYHGTLGEIKPGVNRWPHLDHELIMSYGLVEEISTVPEPPELEAAPTEPTLPSVDSPTSTRRRGARHAEPDAPSETPEG